MRLFNQLSSGKFRNMNCPCCSGKKIKNCCGKQKIVSKEEHDKIQQGITDAQKRFVNTMRDAENEEYDPRN